MKKAKPGAKKPAAKSSAPKKRGKAAPAEHRVSVAGVAVAVTYGKRRSEEFELRGTATVNVGVPEAMVRTTGFVSLAARAGAGTLGEIAYDPASLSRNLVLTLRVDDADLKLLRDIFVTGTGREGSDPGLIIWARTAAALPPSTSATLPVVEFGYRLDFDPDAMG